MPTKRRSIQNTYHHRQIHGTFQQNENFLLLDKRVISWQSFWLNKIVLLTD